MSLAILVLKWVIDSFYGWGGVSMHFVCAKMVYKLCRIGLTLRLWKYGEMPHFDIFFNQNEKTNELLIVFLPNFIIWGRFLIKN